MTNSKRDFYKFLLSLLIVFFTAIALLWLNTGTLSPFASTYYAPIVSGPCHYLYNPDHSIFLSTYLMLDGAPSSEWMESIALRRILYPLVAYPFMKVWGFELGGFIASLLIYVVTFWSLIIFINKKFGRSTALWGAWIFATYPGVAYWIGMPFSYSLIPAVSLFTTVLIDKLLEKDRGLRQVILIAFLIGVGGLAHDTVALGALMAGFFGLIFQKRFAHILCFLPIVVAPLLITQVIITSISGTSIVDSNTVYYPEILKSYFTNFQDPRWREQILVFPEVLLLCFFASNFIFLPVLAFFYLRGSYLERKRVAFFRAFSISETSWLFAYIFIVAIINLAPLYGTRFSMRGVEYSRYYQFLFGPIFFYCCRHISSLKYAKHAALICVMLNVAVVLGPWLSPRFTSAVYALFYRHSNPEDYVNNLNKFGRIPLGGFGCPLAIEAIPLSKSYLSGAAKWKVDSR
jgi:hypothetical protein